MQFEALVEEVVGTSVTVQQDDDHESVRPSSIVVSEAEDALQTSSNRNSILSNSSVDSARSDTDRNIQLGTSVFYVNWD